MALPAPANVTVNIFRGFSASSPYGVSGNPITANGYLEHHMRNGRFGFNTFLHWTHVLYLPVGTDIRSSYNSELNSWASANADTILVQDYPIPGQCTAFVPVLIQRVARGQPTDHLRIHLDRMQPLIGNCPQGGGTISTACCPNLLPATLHATFANISSCACLDGLSVTLTWDGSSKWVGTASVNCGFPTTLTATLQCQALSTDCTGFLLTLTCDGSNFENRTPTACACSPLNLSFTYSLYFGCCGPGENLRVTVTT